MQKDLSFKQGFWLLLCILMLTTLPFLGLTDFNSRGEPREAIVSVTMLQQDNWILPTNNGGEMAYKPPFFHWCIAAVSQLWGQVTEYTSRFPSAVSAFLMLLGMYLFYARSRNASAALLAVLLCFSTFEVHRAVYACRVDMALTSCMVLAMMSFYQWYVKKNWYYWLLAILLMSIGTLTKGPVAIVLPCGVIGLYVLIKELWHEKGSGMKNVLPKWLMVVCASVLALILPALWYYAAYQQGGEQFLTLVKEENLDRFLGKMTYASHENPFWYYIPIGLASFLPWSLVPVIGMIVVGYNSGDCKAYLSKIWENVRKMDGITLFSWVAFWTIIVFYCIPKSKRGVYILPLYPFGAWLISLYLKTLLKPVVVKRLVLGVLSLWLIADAIVLPFIQNRKSDKDIALKIAELIPADAHLTSFVAGSEPHNPMHYFTINYYLSDRVDAWDESKTIPAEGYLIVGEKDAPDFIKEHPNCQFEEIFESQHRSCDTHQKVKLYRYEK